MTSFRKVVLPLSAIALAGIAACSSGAASSSSAKIVIPAGLPGTAALVQQARAEGGVTLYSTVPTATEEKDAAAFEKAYDVPVNMPITFVSTGQFEARLKTEISSNSVNADVVMWGDVAQAQVWAKQGVFAPLPANSLPESTKYYALPQVEAQGMDYNTQEVSKSEVPTTWDDLLEPQFKGKIGLASPEISPNFCATYYALLQDPKYGAAYFEKLAAQKPQIINSLPLMAQTVASGSVAIAVVDPQDDVYTFDQANASAPVAWAPLDVSELIADPMAIMAKAPHPAAAKLFAMWLMSKAGQQTHNGDGGGASLLGSLPGTLDLPPADTNHAISFTALASDQQTIISLFNKLF